MQGTHESHDLPLSAASAARHTRRRHPFGRVTQIGLGVTALTLALALSGCGGDVDTAPDQPTVDNTAYSGKAGDGLNAAQANEQVAVAHHQWTDGSGKNIAYTTTTGHLTATSPSGQPEASMSYVAYTAPSQDGSNRPVTFFYNGGPGSASIWLRLGSFAPTRVATPDPYMGNWPNYPEVPNKESLIATTDMVFIDPPGTGLSEAILPNTNKTFWGADPDVNVMRDFIKRYIAANHRTGSPAYLYGESYGGPRTAMLSLALETAGVHLTGVVLQSPILNYFSGMPNLAQTFGDNTSALKYSTDSMAGLFPSFAQVAAFFGQVSPAPSSPLAYAPELSSFVTTQYDTLAKYGQTFEFAGSPLVPNPIFPDSPTYAQWSGLTGMSVSALNAYFGNAFYGTSLVPGSTIGRYDGRVSLPNSDPRLASDSDPSDILISTPFTNVLATQMPNVLKYKAPNATYIPLNNDVINAWDFSHGGQVLPDTVPDLLAAIKLNPALKVLTLHGWHDLATPYVNTEHELARLKTVANLQADVQIKEYTGGHMIYLDDGSRQQLMPDLVQYYQSGAVKGATTLAGLGNAWPDATPANTPAATNVATVTTAVKGAAN